MGKIVLLAVAAAWAAVLLPPLLRSRMENRPGSSVTDFRRQLSTLQRAVPTRSISPMRGMSRPLVQSTGARPAVRPGQRSHAATIDLAAARSASLDRRQAAARPTHTHRVSRRAIVRRRRANVLFILVMAVVITLFLAATTKAHSMVYAFALAFVSLCGYVYKLAQLRQYEQDREFGEANWFNAA